MTPVPSASEPWTSTRRFDVGFFDDRNTQAAIKRIATASKVTLYVGAGASIDQGLPAWGQLVSSLLAERIRLPPEYPISDTVIAETRDVAAALTRTYGEVSTASLVDALYMREYPSREDAIAARNRDIARNMYANTGTATSDPAGYLATYIVYLAATLKAFDCDIEIATTNYDLGLEEAQETSEIVRALLQEAAELANSEGQELTQVEIPVVHLHGQVGREGAGQDVVFSEIEYASSSQAEIVGYLRDRTADDGVLLIIGSSLRDTDLVAAFADISADGDWDRSRAIGLLPIQNELAAVPDHDPSHFIGDIRDYVSARGEDFGLSILRPDFYSQVYQFLQEVVDLLRLGKNYVAYEERLRQWWRAWEVPVYANERARRRVTEGLQDIVVDHLPDLRATTEHLKIELWVRSNPDSRLFELWCSSQSMWLSAVAHRPHQAPIATDTEYVAVSCFAQRVTLRGSTRALRPGRWTHFVAVPVLLTEDPYAVLPVGVAIAFFDAPAAQSDDLRDPSNFYEFSRLETDLGSIGLRSLAPSFAEELIDP
jgi:hypothetical protein